VARRKLDKNMSENLPVVATPKTEKDDASLRIRATLMLRNDAMIEARSKLGLTQFQAADFADVPSSVFIQLEKLSYTGKVENLQKYAERIATAFEIAIDAVLPPGLKGKTIESKIVRQVTCSVHQLENMAQNDVKMIPSPTYIDNPVDTDAINSEMLDKLSQALRRLSYREREVLKLRFGLGENKGDIATCAEIGTIFGVTAARIHSIEGEAIRKLGNRCPELLEFVQNKDSFNDLIVAAKPHITAGDYRKARKLLQQARDSLSIRDREDDPRFSRVDRWIKDLTSMINRGDKYGT
jgi:RNA polymerase sigma factor (sigma-70 family)